MDPKPLTRKELAEFLPNQRAVRAFEKLFDLVPNNLVSQQIQIEALEIVSSLAVANSNEAISALENLTSAITALALAPKVDELVTSQSIMRSELDQISSEYELTPRVELGTLASQNDDEVVISGGQIDATITDDSTNLIASSSTITNGAGVAAGTLNNSPTAGNPTKWMPVNDNGTIRYVPGW